MNKPTEEILLNDRKDLDARTIAGHMRAFVGRAYVPEMVPSGFRAETIR